MVVRTSFVLSLYGVSGVLIEYSAHNCRYCDFRPSETLIMVILGHFVTLRRQYPINGPSPTPQWPMVSQRPFIFSLYRV